MAIEQTTLLSQLLVDIENPRFPEIQPSQRAAIQTMVRIQGDRIVALAQHIVDYGLNPSTLTIVMPSEVEDDMYEVLDGNRRTTALKLLDNPSLAEGILSGTSLQRIKQLSIRFQASPITKVRCVVVADRDEADTWIPLLHRGQKEGAGLVEWDGQVAARYDARKGEKSEALQVLDFIRDKAQLSPDTRRRIDEGKFPITTLGRLIHTPYVRGKLGIDKADGTVTTSYPEEEVLKGLTRIVEDLGSGTLTVSRLKTQDQRIDYINLFSKEELPERATILPKASTLESAPRSTGVANTPPSNIQQDTTSVDDSASTASTAKVGDTSITGTAKSARYTPRSTLIPKKYKLALRHHRLSIIFKELKDLPLEKYKNAGAIMLRVFIELTVDYFLEHKIQWPDQQIQNSSLAQKITGVANYLEANNLMTADELTPIRKAASGQTLIVATVKSMNSYVHNRHFSPIPSELTTVWDDFQPFITKVWQTL